MLPTFVAHSHSKDGMERLLSCFARPDIRNLQNLALVTSAKVYEPHWADESANRGVARNG
jgi:hypothetical protein